MVRTNGFTPGPGFRLVGAVLLAVLFVVPTAVARADTTCADGGPSPAAVRAALGRAADRLWAECQGGHWPAPLSGVEPADPAGRTALCALALLAGGESPQSERMAAVLDWLRVAPTQSVLSRGYRVWVLADVASPAPDNALANDLGWLLAAARPDGAYGHAPAAGSDADWNNPCTAVAQLAVWKASRAGHPVPDAYWRRARRHWLATQTAEGGWSFAEAGRAPDGRCTALALASLHACADALVGERQEADQRLAVAAINRGRQWLDEHFQPRANPGKGPQNYFGWLHALALAEQSDGARQLAGVDWSAHAAEAVLCLQDPLGGWDGAWDDRVQTCHAMAFLAHRLRPMLLQVLSDGDLDPVAPARLARQLSRRFELHGRWARLGPDATEDQLAAAPLLLLTGDEALQLTPEQERRLRRYALRGGLIVSTPTGRSQAFNVAMRTMLVDLFPEWSPRPVEADASLLSAPQPLRVPMRLLGVFNGVRPLALHSDEDLLHRWRSFRVDPDALALMGNLYTHATGGALRTAGDWLPPAPKAEAVFIQRVPTVAADGEERTLTVALATPTGEPLPEPMAYSRLAEAMAGCGRPVRFLRLDTLATLAELDPRTVSVVMLTGTKSFTLGEEAARAMRAYLDAGGLVISDAAGGRDDYGRSAEIELAGLLEEYYPAVEKAGQSQILSRIADDCSALSAFPRSLTGLALRDRLLIVQSRDDLTASLAGVRSFGIRGLGPETAEEVVCSLLIHAADRPAPDRPVLSGLLEVQWAP